jgi:hypothetical protein
MDTANVDLVNRGRCRFVMLLCRSNDNRTPSSRLTSSTALTVQTNAPPEVRLTKRWHVPLDMDVISPAHAGGQARARGVGEGHDLRGGRSPPSLRSLTPPRRELFAVCVANSGCSRPNQNVQGGATNPAALTFRLR